MSRCFKFQLPESKVFKLFEQCTLLTCFDAQTGKGRGGRERKKKGGKGGEGRKKKRKETAYAFYKLKELY